MRGLRRVGVHAPTAPGGTTIRRGSYDPKARLDDMDLDMIQAQVIYPSLAPHRRFFGDDPELQVACVRAYNDWIHEFCAVAPDRLVGMPIAPATGVDDMLAEWRRIADRGDRGFVISGYPSGEPVPTDDRRSVLVGGADWEYAVHIHFGFASGVALTAHTGVGYLTSAGLIDMGIGMYRPIADLVYSGVFDRFPRCEDRGRRGGHRVVARTSATTSTTTSCAVGSVRTCGSIACRVSTCATTCWATFIEDPLGIRDRHRIGVDQHHVVDGLPTHQLQLAELAAHRGVRVPGRARGRTASHHARQRGRAVPPRLSVRRPAAPESAARGEDGVGERARCFLRDVVRSSERCSARSEGLEPPTF